MLYNKFSVSVVWFNKIDGYELSNTKGTFQSKHLCTIFILENE